MSTQDEALDWDSVLGGVEAEEEKRKKEGKSDNDFEAIPKGPYRVIVQEANKQVASTGKDMIKARVQVTEGPSVNRILFNYFVFGSKDDVTLNRITLDNLAAFGVTREYIATQRPSIAEIAEALVGLEAIAIVGIQEKGDYAGNNEIKRFKPLEGVEPAVPKAASAAKTGIPDVPKPGVPVEQAAAVTAPVIPLPEVPVGDGSAEEPFE